VENIHGTTGSRRNPLKRSYPGDQNHVVPAPGPTAGRIPRRFTNRVGRPSRRRDFLEFALREERDELLLLRSRREHMTPRTTRSWSRNRGACSLMASAYKHHSRAIIPRRCEVIGDKGNAKNTSAVIVCVGSFRNSGGRDPTSSAAPASSLRHSAAGRR